VIFVDVRTEDGSDASAMFVQMLKRLNAKIITRPGTTATHIVWKSGLQSTLTRYSVMEAPKPLLVGIGWVVQCVEKKQKVDEKRFLVDVKEAEVHFGGKRRKSLQVKDRSILISGGVPRPLQRTVSNPVSLSAHRPPSSKHGVTGRVTQQKLAFGKGKARVPPMRPVSFPSPVKEVSEMPQLEIEIEEVLPLPPQRGPGADSDMIAEPVTSALPPSSASLRTMSSREMGPDAPTPVRKEPMFSLTKAKPTPPVPPTLPPNQAPPSSRGSPKEDHPLANFSELLAETQTSLLAEAQESQLERARRRSLLFAPKVSSPLKKNFRIF